MSNLIDPVGTGAFDLANKDALWWDVLPNPTSMGGTLLDDEPMFANYRFKAKSNRKLDLHRHGIVMALSGFSALDTSISIVARGYVKY